MILAGGPVVRAFASIGWIWGGTWHSVQDLQHAACDMTEWPQRSRCLRHKPDGNSARYLQPDPVEPLHPVSEAVCAIELSRTRTDPCCTENSAGGGDSARAAVEPSRRACSSWPCPVTSFGP